MMLKTWSASRLIQGRDGGAMLFCADGLRLCDNVTTVELCVDVNSKVVAEIV